MLQRQKRWSTAGSMRGMNLQESMENIQQARGGGRDLAYKKGLKRGRNAVNRGG